MPGYVAAKHPETALQQEIRLVEHMEIRLEHSETAFVVLFSEGDRLVVNWQNYGPGVDVEQGAS